MFLSREAQKSKKLELEQDKNGEKCRFKRQLFSFKRPLEEERVEGEAGSRRVHFRARLNYGSL